MRLGARSSIGLRSRPSTRSRLVDATALPPRTFDGTSAAAGGGAAPEKGEEEGGGSRSGGSGPGIARTERAWSSGGRAPQPLAPDAGTQTSSRLDRVAVEEDAFSRCHPGLVNVRLAEPSAAVATLAALVTSGSTSP